MVNHELELCIPKLPAVRHLSETARLGGGRGSERIKLRSTARFLVSSGVHHKPLRAAGCHFPPDETEQRISRTPLTNPTPTASTVDSGRPQG
jgi:Lon protease-like protein